MDEVEERGVERNGRRVGGGAERMRWERWRWWERGGGGGDGRRWRRGELREMGG